MKRNLSIDLIKVVAMMMVLALHMHLYKPLEEHIPSYVYGINCIAVPLFFMVSGFLMCNKSVSLKYSFQKVIGILRFVFITISIYILARFIFKGEIPYRYYYLWIFQRGAFWHYWYFAAMIIIYMLAPVLVKIIHSKYFHVIFSTILLLSFGFFVLDSCCDFERTYIRQTFRVWYWIMFFLAGGRIFLYKNKIPPITFLWAIAASVVYTLFQASNIANVNGNEYYFGSILCLIYAVIVFAAFLNYSIDTTWCKRIIQEMSILFLPVYAIHPFIIKSGTLAVSQTSFFTDYAEYSIIILSLSYFLMKLPYMNHVFKI